MTNRCFIPGLSEDRSDRAASSNAPRIPDDRSPATFFGVAAGRGETVDAAGPGSRR